MEATYKEIREFCKELFDSGYNIVGLGYFHATGADDAWDNSNSVCAYPGIYSSKSFGNPEIWRIAKIYFGMGCGNGHQCFLDKDIPTHLKGRYTRDAWKRKLKNKEHRRIIKELERNKNV